MSKKLENDRFTGVTVREAVKRTVWARTLNSLLAVTHRWKLPLAAGHQIFWILKLLILLNLYSVEPLPEDRNTTRIAKVSIEGTSGKQDKLLISGMTWLEELYMPPDGPYKPRGKVFVWTSPVNANSIESKAWKKERWVRGTVIS